MTDARAWATSAFTYDLNAAPLQIDLSILQEAFWKNAGFDVTRKELQNADLITKVYVERSYDAAQWGMGADPACLWCSLSTWRSDDPTNISGFKSKAMDAALDTLRAASQPGGDQDGDGHGPDSVERGDAQSDLRLPALGRPGRRSCTGWCSTPAPPSSSTRPTWTSEHGAAWDRRSVGPGTPRSASRIRRLTERIRQYACPGPSRRRAARGQRS